MIQIKRTNSENLDFVNLVTELNTYLKQIDGEEHEFYNQFNNIDVLKHTVVVYQNLEAVSCGAFKQFDENCVEIKRMYTKPNFRGKSFGTHVLKELENWAKELGFKACILETGKRQKEAVQFYKKNNYTIIPNFGPYKDIANSVCFIKQF